MGNAVIKFTYIQRSSYAATPQAALEIALVTDVGSPGKFVLTVA